MFGIFKWFRRYYGLLVGKIRKSKKKFIKIVNCFACTEDVCIESAFMTYFQTSSPPYTHGAHNISVNEFRFE